MRPVAGIDVSARRGLHLALLEEGRRVQALAHLPDVPAVVDWLAARAPDAVAAIDAPMGPRLPLLEDPAFRATLVPPPPACRYLRYRACDYQLARRGIGLYLSPAAGEPVPDWMAVGFALFAALHERGLRPPAHAGDHAARLLEVYPFGVFVSLLGYIPPRKTTPEGRAARLAALAGAGIAGLPEAAGHDSLDAVAAAYGGARFSAGQGCALGDPGEGLLVLPVPEDALPARYPRRPIPSLQLPARRLPSRL